MAKIASSILAEPTENLFKHILDIILIAYTLTNNKNHSSSTKKLAEPPVHLETASSADSNSSSGLEPVGLSEYDVGSGGISVFSGAGADLSSK